MGFGKLWRRAIGKSASRPATSTSEPPVSNSQLAEPTSQRQAEAAQPSPQQSSNPVLFPYGIEVLYSCENATVDICFVHGLTGDRIRTWKHKDETEPWPKALLPLRLKKARILTFGYDAYVLRASVASTNRLIDHATDLLTELTSNRAENNASSRPIIFVAHSLGGIVCKETILMSRNNPDSHLEGIFNFTKAIIFMGTPHQGSWMAQWAKITATGLGVVKSTNKSLLEVLETDNQYLESIHTRFVAMIRDLERNNRQLHVTCFFEQLPLPTVGVVVSKDSATFPGYNPISIHANHRGMTKFASAEDTGFKRLIGELTRWEAEISAQGIHNESVEHPGTRYVSFKAEAVATSDSSSESDTAPSMNAMNEEYLSIALNLFKVPCYGTFKTRAYEAATNVLAVLEQEDVLKAIVHYRSRQRRESRSQSDKRKALEAQLILAYNGARSRCLKSLSFPEMGVREASIGQPAESTCTWIYTDPEYTSWEQNLNSLLWIKGKPGSGKSTLMRSLSQKRKGAKPDTDIAYLSFFFNARGSAVEKTPIGLYITLLHKLLRDLPLIMCEFLPLFLEKEFRSQNGKVSWQLAEIADFFHAIIGQPQPKYIEIMIDALDECEEEEVREVILRFEKSIANARTSRAELKACWSSRYYPNISLRSENGLELRLDKQNHADIRRYVAAELTIEKDAVFAHIREELISRANGVFLWAVLVSKRLIKGVDQGKDEAQLKELFNSIPAKLEDLFDEIFVRTDIPTDDHRDLLHIAQWILCAFRPLTLTELFTALSLQKSNTPIALKNLVVPDDIELGANISTGRVAPPSSERDLFSRLERQITDLSGGLFEVVRSTGTGFGTRVQVIHESVREFFLGPKGLQLLQIPSRELFISTGHKALALGCFRALLAKEFDNAFERPKIKDSTSISDVWKFLTVQWEPPENTFLTNYVQSFVFEHFDLSKNHFRGDYTPESPFESLKVRRRALENFLRLSCSHITEEQTLPTGFSAHIQKLGTEAAAFDLKDTELSDLITFLNNLSACSSFFTPRHIYMYQPFGTSFPDESLQKTYLALFYLFPRSEQAVIPVSTFFTSPVNNNKDIEPFGSKINFCFGMTFQATEQILSQDSDWEIPRMRSNTTPASLPRIIHNWRFAQDMHEFSEFRDYQSILRSFPKAKLHEYSRPTTLCLFLRHPEELSESSKSFIANPGVKGKWSDDNLSNIVLGYGRGSLPKGSWWRRRQQGRDRDIFEADTEDESDDDAGSHFDDLGSLESERGSVEAGAQSSLLVTPTAQSMLAKLSQRLKLRSQA